MLIFHKNIDVTTIRNIDEYIRENLQPGIPGASGLLNDQYEDLDILLNQKALKFADKLISIMNLKKISKNSDVYKPIHMSRKVFTSIIGGQRPSEDSAIMIAFGLNLTVDETQDLLETAGYRLSNSYKRDIIIRYCIQNKKTISETDDILYHYKEKTLFS